MNIYVSEQTHGLGIYVVYKLTDSKNKIRKYYYYLHKRAKFTYA